MKSKEFTVDDVTYKLNLFPVNGAVGVHRWNGSCWEDCGDGMWNGRTISDMTADLGEDVYTAAELACIDLD